MTTRPRADLGAHACRIDVGDARTSVTRVGTDAGLRPGQRDGLDARGLEGHGHERAADVLAGGQQQVHLARIGIVGDGGRELEEVVRGVAHGADDHDEVRARRAGRGRCAAATWRMRSASASEEPPYFWTMSGAIVAESTGRPSRRPAAAPTSSRTRRPRPARHGPPRAPARPSSCARRSMAAATRGRRAGSSLKATTVEPAPGQAGPHARRPRGRPRGARAAPGRPPRGTARGAGRACPPPAGRGDPGASAATVSAAAPTLCTASANGTLAGSAVRMAAVESGRSGM